MPWQLDHQQATLKSKSFVARFELDKPFLGLSIADGGVVEISQLFAFLVSDSPLETYVRGIDLANRYPPRNSDLVSYHTYYRATPDGDGIECILSAQTSLLESSPLTEVTSSFANAKLCYKPSRGSGLVSVEDALDLGQDQAPEFFLIRPEVSKDHSWVVFVNSTDFHRGRVSLQPSPTISFQVFPDSLEKGVIRRARFSAHRVARRDDETWAAKLLSQAEAESPLLGT